MKVIPILTPKTKINSKWINDLNISTKTVKFLEENIGVNVHDIRFGNGFLDMTPKVHATNQKNR